MNLLVPANRIETVPVLCQKGADELYVGFYDPDWESEFGEFSNLNRMSSFSTAANPYSLDQLEALIELSHSYHAKVYITLNAETYRAAMRVKIGFYLKRIAEMGADGVIVSEPSVARMANALGIKTIASTMCGIYNSDIARFYINEGVKRIILPRDLSVSEIAEIMKEAPEAEYEVFLMRSGCKFADSFCLGFHYDRCGALCQNLKRSEISFHGDDLSFRDRQLALLNEKVYHTLFSSSEACGLCALYRLIHLGVAAGKIVGRAENHERILEDIEIVRKNISIANGCKSEEEYLAQMIFPQNRDRICFMGKTCYYPELRFGSFGKAYDK